MKRHFLIIITLTLAAMITSCTKDGNKEFKGNYTFKTGGYVTLTPAPAAGDDIVLAHQPESGQMDILDNGKDGKMLVTMNILNGTALVFEATVEDDTLELTPYTRIVTLMQSKEITFGARVTISGTARKLDNILVFDLIYEGIAMINGMSYKINASHIEQIAKEN